MTQPKRIIIVGAKFGELYLNHFIEPNSGLELAGIVSTGSQRANNLADSFGVPHYDDINSLPEDIDIACVVVRASVIGGQGSLLVEQLLKKYIHVLQEHPVSVIEFNRHIALAQRHNVQYRVHSFYAATPAGATFINAANQVKAQLGEVATHGTVTTSRQLLYSSLDFLLQSLDEHEQITAKYLGRHHHFDLINLICQHGEYLLKLQNYLDPADPDMHNLVMHNILLGWPSGYLSIVDSHGPVTWSPTLHVRNHLENSLSLYQTASISTGDYLHQTTTSTLYKGGHSWLDCFEKLGPQGVGDTLNELQGLIEGRETNQALKLEHQRSLALLWENILELVGKQKNISLKPTPHINVNQLTTSVERS